MHNTFPSIRGLGQPNKVYLGELAGLNTVFFSRPSLFAVLLVLFANTAIAADPVAVDDSPTAIDEGGSISGTFNVLDNDTDADGDSLTAVLVSSPSNASSFTLNSDGTFDYTHDSSETTSDTFTYQANDGTTSSNVATVTISITAVNDAPVAVDDSPTAIDEGGSISSTFNVLDNDTDAEGDSLTAVLVSSPSNASSFTLNSDGTFDYTHDGSTTTTDSFTYQANDGTDDSNVVTVTLAITAVNDAPVAVDDSPTAIDEGGSISGTFNVLTNDTDADGDSLTAVLDSSPSNASVDEFGVSSFTLNSDGTFSYTHDGSETTTDSFTYLANDGTDDSNVATVTITITATNDAPVAVDDTPTAIDEGGSISGTFNVLDNDTDSEGDALTAVLDSSPSNASVDEFGVSSFTLNSDGTFSYTHDGSETTTDSFTYMANDGVNDSEVATVTISINGVNDVPEVVTLIGDQSASEDSLFALDISTNFSDPDGDPLTFSATGLPASLAITDPDAGVIEGTPLQEEAETNGGIYSVTITATDDSDEFVSDSFTLTIIQVNDAPAATAQTLVTDEDTPLLVVLTGIDEEADPLSFSIVDQPINGSLTGISPDLTYSPNPDFNGADSFTFTANDGELTSEAVTISITINSINDSPILVGEIEDQLAVEASLFVLDLSNYFTDVDGDILTYSLTGELPESGTIFFNTETGVLSGTPVLEDARDNDPYIITIVATDEIIGSTDAAETFNLAISALDRANVSLTIDVAPDPAMLNDELSWTFNVENTVGPQAASNVALTGAFVGDGLSISSTSSCSINPGATVSPMVTNFECTVGSVSVGESVPIILNSTATLVGDATVFAIAEGLDAVPIDPNIDDNSNHFAVGIAEVFSNGAVQVLGTAGIRAAAAGDLNGDGAPELISGTSAGQPVQIWINSGFRDFAAAPITLSDTGSNEGVAVADFDQDGNLDIVVANGNGEVDRVWGGDGMGNFSLMANLTSTFANGVAVGDFNNDGKLDIAIAAEGGNPIFHGNGNGGFSLQRELSDASSQDVAVADFNNDGRDDVVFANSGGSSKIYNGARNITLSALAIGDVTSVAVAELGGNSRPDLVFGRIPSGIGDAPSNPVFIYQDGFSSPSSLLGAAPTFDVHTGDVNSDGLTDIVFINSSGVHQIWNADPNGNFELYSEQIVADSSIAGVLGEFGYTDIDQPGGVDLAMGGGFPQLGLGVYLNDGFGNLGRGDAVPPVLTLNGNSSVSVPSGSAYNDEGATAEDNIDGDISGSISVTSNVNTQVVGTYTVTYNVTDFAGNAAESISRSVNVDPAAGTGGGGGGMVDLILLFSLLMLWCSSNARRISMTIFQRHN